MRELEECKRRPIMKKMIIGYGHSRSEGKTFTVGVFESLLAFCDFEEVLS